MLREMLGVSRRTIYNRIREGRLQTIRTLGGSQRVLIDSVQAISRRQTVAVVRREFGLTNPYTPQRWSDPWWFWIC